MANQSGPGRKRCYGITIDDLSDVSGFHNAAEDNKIYGLEFVNNCYRRKSIDITPSQPSNVESSILDPSVGEEDKIYGFKFKNNSYAQAEIIPGNLEDLSNVEINDPEQNVKYSLLKNEENKWIIVNEPDWLIDLSIKPQNIFIGKDHRLKKIINNGRDFVSYVPNRKSLAFVAQYKGDYYLRGAVADPSVTIALEMVEEFKELNYKTNRKSTLVLILNLGIGSEDFIPILPGLKIKWTNPTLCKIYVHGNQVILGAPTNAGVVSESDSTIKLEKIFLHNYVLLKRLLFIDSVVPNEYLQTL